MTSSNDLKPRKLPVQERSKFTVQAILEAAIQVFTENGYTSATTDLIAELAGVSIGTFYQYFPNKKAVLIELWNRNMADADKGRDLFIKSINWEGGLDPHKIELIVKSVIDLHKSSVKPHLFFEEIPQPDFIKERLIEKENTSIGYYKAILDYSANIRLQNTDISARIIHEVLERLIHRYLTHFQHEMAEDELIKEASDIISRYLFAS